MKPVILFSLLISSLFTASSTIAATYKWTDEKGNVHYTQHPPADGSYERMKVDKSRPTYGEPETPPPTGQPSTATTKSSSNGAVVKDELAKNAEIRTKNCESAKKNLEILTVYKRYKDKDGNVVRMDDNERAQKIEEAKQNISEFCE